MELEQPSGDSAAVDTATATNEAEALDTTDSLLDEDLPDGQTPADGDEEEEVEGVKLKGKKEALEKFKSERLMQADYTRKTQEVADNRRALQQREEAFQKNAQSHQQYIQEVARVVAIDDRLAQFANANWSALTDQDPVQALKLHTEFTQLQAQKGQLVNAITQKQNQAQHEQQRSTARQLMEARQVLERDIKGWSPELAGKLTEFGIKVGFPREVLDTVTQPAVVKMLHKAYLYDQLEQQRAKKAPVDPARPVTRIGAGSAANTKRLSEMSDAEYSAARQKYKQTHR